MKKNKLLFVIPFIVVIVFIGFWLYFNTGIKKFEKDVSNIELPENVEVIAIQSGIGDSGGNGDQSTYRAVLVVKTKMSKEELNQYFNKSDLTLPSGLGNRYTSACNITYCNDSLFESDRRFTLNFNELENVIDFTDYYFLEFIK